MTESPPSSDEGTLVRWELSPQSWMREACVTAGRGLNLGDWQRYAGGLIPGYLACVH